MDVPTSEAARLKRETRFIRERKKNRVCCCCHKYNVSLGFVCELKNKVTRPMDRCFIDVNKVKGV